MQIYADVLGHPMLIAGSPQTPALGSAIAASVAAGTEAAGHASFEAAQDRMSSLKEKRFTPNPLAKAAYDELYSLYRELHDAFGGVRDAKWDFASFMKRLLVIRERQSSREETAG